MKTKTAEKLSSEFPFVSKALINVMCAKHYYVGARLILTLTHPLINPNWKRNRALRIQYLVSSKLWH